ncbi:TMEM165/GDT1 family protein [Tolypothrix sp. PCC 7910]|nr:TMEM165/GDT1 family protein [Tolypothrix sp. PCC 7910]
MLGGELAELLPLQLIKLIAALGFAYLGVHLLYFEQRSSSHKKQSFVENKTVYVSWSKKLFNKQDNNFWSVFSSSFVTIFLASIGDEEQIATLLLSAHSRSPWIVLIGATLAVISTSFLAVLLGRGLARSLSPKILKIASGVILLLFSLWLFLEMLNPGKFDL